MEAVTLELRQHQSVAIAEQTISDSSSGDGTSGTNSLPDTVGQSADPGAVGTLSGTNEDKRPVLESSGVAVGQWASGQSREELDQLLIQVKELEEQKSRLTEQIANQSSQLVDLDQTKEHNIQLETQVGGLATERDALIREHANIVAHLQGAEAEICRLQVTLA